MLDLGNRPAMSTTATGQHVPGIGTTSDRRVAYARADQIITAHEPAARHRIVRFGWRYPWLSVRWSDHRCKNCSQPWPCPQVEWANRMYDLPVKRPRSQVASHRGQRSLRHRVVMVAATFAAPAAVAALLVWLATGGR